MLRSTFKLFLAIIFLLCPLSTASTQTVSLEFEWTNPNLFPVTFNIYEVSAPPNDETIISRVNPFPITSIGSSHSWTCDFQLDDNIHYFRMTSCRFDTLESTLSNVTLIHLTIGPLTPKNFIVSFPNKGNGDDRHE